MKRCGVDELYILAREVLLDALDALARHRNAIVLVGAQAIYLHVGDADLAVSPFTTDGDLVLNPDTLGENPALEKALAQAGFAPKAADSVGIWIAERETSSLPKVNVAIDLLVPRSVSPGGGRRAAHLLGHSHRAARIVSGLEGALVDNDQHILTSLSNSASRKIEISVAGPAALLVAKVHKIQDRENSFRANDKDALDVFRLLRGVSLKSLVARYRAMLDDQRSADAAGMGLRLFEQQFGRIRASGVEMVVRSLQGIMDENEVAASCELLANDLLLALKASP